MQTRWRDDLISQPNNVRDTVRDERFSSWTVRRIASICSSVKLSGVLASILAQSKRRYGPFRPKP